MNVFTYSSGLGRDTVTISPNGRNASCKVSSPTWLSSPPTKTVDFCFSGSLIVGRVTNTNATKRLDVASSSTFLISRVRPLEADSGLAKRFDVSTKYHIENVVAAAAAQEDRYSI